MTDSPRPSLVWDLPVRLFHWTLVAAVLTAFVTDKLGVAYFRYHLWAGYLVILLVFFRLGWGLLGSRHARFGNFLRGPKAILAYVRQLLSGQHVASVGHNPLGALMVVALLLGLAAQAGLGLFGDDDIFNTGPLNGYVLKDTALLLTSIHRKLFYGLLGAVLLHVGAVAAHWLLFRENLLIPMITGRKWLAHEPDQRPARLWLAAVLLAIGAALLTWLVTSAPLAGGADF